MLLLLKPRRLSAPVDFADSDSASWTDGGETAGFSDTEAVGWYELWFPNKRPKRNTLLSTWTSGVPTDVRHEGGLDGV